MHSATRIEMLAESFNERPFVFRLNDSGVGPLLLSQVCLERGWKEYNPDTNEQWNLWWRTSGFPVGHYRSLHTWQYINHVPQGSLICRKDNLVRYLRCMKKVYGPIYDFSPNGYNLPSEYTKLAAEYASDRPSSGKDHNSYDDDKPVWICKPVSQSQGKGIFLFRVNISISRMSPALVKP
ncbi:Tubulin-tyrosine ligase family [Popillia japonica]|uniref:Tubulin-tyrosine ligase family n=1 Tax=Popillia japonica TaxID=7064 RepID=A0AAW1KK82_POPJA